MKKHKRQLYVWLMHNKENDIEEILKVRGGHDLLVAVIHSLDQYFHIKHVTILKTNRTQKSFS
jgi:hypothetical protein